MVHFPAKKKKTLLNLLTSLKIETNSVEFHTSTFDYKYVQITYSVHS